MAKVMLVEDDTNLSEIYRARLEAEGYTIVTAHDGEEALALAVKEKPDLIVCDVMMPKISGFEMLDILRGTEGVQNTRVIMMTALSQAEDKARAMALGADRYLVKSQVTLEDVVAAVKEVLSDNPAAAAAGTPPADQPTAQTDDAQAASDQTPPTVADTPEQPEEAPSASPMAETSSTTAPEAPEAPASAPEPAIDPNLGESSSQEQADMAQQIEKFVEQTPPEQPASEGNLPAFNLPTEENTPPLDTTPDVPPASNAPAAAPADQPNEDVSIPGKKVIKPLNDVNAKPDFDLLLAKEQQKDVEQGQAQPVVGTLNDTPPATGYLGASPSQAGQFNPNTGEGIDPNNIAI